MSLDEGPMSMAFDRFTEEGIALFRPAHIPVEALARGPVRARFVSAHFLFAPGRFVEDVPYDPELYFLGEEITLAVRAFSHGYDLFHPSEVIVWHEYTRAGRNKHWDDHTAERGVAQGWHTLDAPSRAKACRLLLDPDHGRFGCGAARSVADYEAYAGVSFLRRRVQDYTRAGGFPPNPPADPDWAGRVRDWRVGIDFDARRLPPAAWTDSQFWFVCIFGADGRELSRQDADDNEIRGLLAGAPARIAFERRFEGSVAPASWTVLPYARSFGWLDARITGPASERTPASDRPLAVAGLTMTEVEQGFMVTRPDDPHRRHLLNSSGALLLEFANGRHSLAEIVETVRDLYALPQSPERDIRDFFERAVKDGLVESFSPECIHV